MKERLTRVRVYAKVYTCIPSCLPWGLSATYESFQPITSAKILAAIHTHLTHNATTPSKRRKLLVNLIPPWEAVPPIWELRVGAYRVFYDVSEADEIVSVRAIRHKPRDKRTEEIL